MDVMIEKKIGGFSGFVLHVLSDLSVFSSFALARDCCE